MPDLIKKFMLAFRLMRDGRVPSWIRVGIPLVVAIYLVSPIDLIPDFLIGLGQIDDIGIVVLGVNLMARFSPAYVVEEHMRALGMSGMDTDAQASKKSKDSDESDPTIEGEYRVVPPDR